MSGKKERAKRQAAQRQTQQAVPVIPPAVVATTAPVPTAQEPVQQRAWLKYFGFGLVLAVVGSILRQTFASQVTITSADQVATWPTDSLEENLLAGNVHPGLFTLATQSTREHLADALEFADVRYSGAEISQALSKKLTEKYPALFLSTVGSAEYNAAYEQVVAQEFGIYEIDQSIAETTFCDVVNGRLVYRNLAKLLEKTPLHKMTAKQLLSLIGAINFQLSASCNKDVGLSQAAEYNQIPGIVSQLGNMLFDETKCTEYLRQNDPEMVPVYKKIVRLSQSQPFDAPNERIAVWGLKYKYRLEGLKKDPKIDQFLGRYLDLYGPEERASVPKDMNELARNLQQALKDRNNDAYKIAALVHQFIVAIHPFADANGRTARIMANAVLMNAGKKPVIFSSNAEYNAQVVREKYNPEWMTKYLKEMAQEYPRTLTFYRTMQDCVDTQPATTCLKIVKDTAGDLLQCRP